MFEIDPVEDLSAAVDWFIEVIPPHELQPYRPPADLVAVDAALARIDAAIAPLALPPEIRWFWQTWDPGAFGGVMPSARVSDPAFALDCWVEGAIEDTDPRALFPFGYESHWFLFVDLTDPVGTPASAWTFGFGNEEYVREFPSFAALLRSCAERGESSDLPQDRSPLGGAERYERYESAFADAHFSSIVERHFAASGHRREAIHAMDRGRWPAAWRLAEQVAVAAPVATGPTHTVARYGEALSVDGTARARLRGSLSWGNSPNAGVLLELADGSGSIPLFAPRGSLPAGWNKAVVVEVEVRGNGPMPLPPSTGPLQRAAYDSVIGASRDGDEREAFNREVADYHAGLASFAVRVPHVETMVVIEI